MPRYKLTSEDQIVRALESEISSQRTVELAVFHMLSCYIFDLDDLRCLVLETGLDFSFSKVKYGDIAPQYRLDPILRGADMKTFEVHRARIPTSLFKAIVEDISLIMKQYGESIDHKNVEARTRYLAPLYNRTIALFKASIRNTPESLISGHTTGELIKYQFTVFGGPSVLLIETELGTPIERCDAIGQVIAECSACDHFNNRFNLPFFPIYGILCNGSTYEFFSFDGSSSPPTISRGVFHPPNPSILALPDYRCITEIDFICKLRPICEALFYILLLAFKNGVQVKACHGENRAQPYENMPQWNKAHLFATQALMHAKDAAAKAAVHNNDADEKAELALECLQQSLTTIPAYYQRKFDLLGSWNEESVKFC